MADNSEAKARRESIERTTFFHGVRHTGTREVLIEAGLAKADQFPGQPGCGKTSTTFQAVGDQKKIQVSRRSTYLFDVVVHFTKAERKEYQARQYAAIEARRKQYEEEGRARVAGARAELRRASLNNGGPRGVANVAMEMALLSLVTAFNMHGDPDIPYSFDPDTIDEVKDLARQIWSLHLHENFTPKTGAIAEADLSFQRFMGAATGTPQQGGGVPS